MLNPTIRRSRLVHLAVSMLPVLLAASAKAGAEPSWTADAIAGSAYQDHAALFTRSRFPSAQQCKTCHEDHYREWSASQHAYAQLSPVFNAMQGKIFQLTNGTSGDFCIRCHTQVGMTLGEPVLMPNLDRDPVSQEGVTCVICHRDNAEHGKVSGRLAMAEGDIFQPVHGPTGNQELKRVLSHPEEYKVVTSPEQQGRPIHTDVRPFFQLQKSAFCGSCHDVTLPNGFRLEEAFSEYKSSPAAARGESCQDCHMGIVPGEVKGFRTAPAARVGGVETLPRKRTNHVFAGPDYSIVHPGIFPHNPKAQKIASGKEWLTFDWEQGWGTAAFEESVSADYVFPERWSDAEDRYDARALIEEQLALLGEVREQRLKLLRTGYVLGEIDAKLEHRGKLALSVEVKNGMDGHNVPTGFTAERVVFVRVTVSDDEGHVLMRSGDFDEYGDLRDAHSWAVRSGDAPLDKQLFSLQSKFVTRNLRGGDREQILAVNQSIDALPFVRPETRSAILTGRPGDARIHKRGIEPNGRRVAKYEVKATALTGKTPYRVKVELIAGMVPVNLIHEIQSVGFDYGMTPKEVARKVVDGYLTLWEREVEVGTGKTSVVSEHAATPTR